MRIKYIVLTLSLALSCLADWSYDDISSMLSNTSQIKYTLSDIKTEQLSQSQYISATASNTASILSQQDRVSLKDYMNDQYLRINEISDGTKYKWGRNSEGVISGIEEVDPFNNNNLTFFNQDDNAKDNTPYYANNILGYYPQNYNISVDSTRPDSAFLDYPEYGDLGNKLITKMNNEGYGIDNIRTSAQTQELRDKITMIDNKANLMFTNNYDNAYINWDFSEIGNFFVRAHLMASNPFINLKGQLRIKPVQGDFHYEIWHRYFDESYSQMAVIYRNCINICFYIAFALYVMNDLMSIVDA